MVAVVAVVWEPLVVMVELLVVMAVMEYHQVYLEHSLLEEQVVVVVKGTVHVSRLSMQQSCRSNGSGWRG